MIFQSELLARTEKLQGQVDDLKRVADLDARPLAERVTELEKTNSLEARFPKLINGAKGGPEAARARPYSVVAGGRLRGQSSMIRR